MSARYGAQKSLTTTTLVADTCLAPSFARPIQRVTQVQPAQQPCARYSRETYSSNPRLQLKNGAQGRIRTSVAHNAADLQSAAINHSATCAHVLPGVPFHNATAHPKQNSGARPPPGVLLKLCWRTLQAGTTSRYNQTLLIAVGKILELAKGFEPPTA